MAFQPHPAACDTSKESVDETSLWPVAIIAEFQTAARLAPEADRPHTNLGNAMLDAGRTAEAIEHLQIALRQPPASRRRITTSAMPGRAPGAWGGAEAESRPALRIDPDFAEAHNNLGRALAQSGGWRRRLRNFRWLFGFGPRTRGRKRLRWRNPGSWGTRLRNTEPPCGSAGFRAGAQQPGFRAGADAGRANGGYGGVREALRLAPEFVDAHYNLAMALWRMLGTTEEAARELEMVQRLRGEPGPGEHVDERSACRHAGSKAGMAA